MKELYHWLDEIRINGPHKRITNTRGNWGDCTAITGNAHNITGDVSRLVGNVSNLYGQVCGVWGDTTNVNLFMFGSLFTYFGDISSITCLEDANNIPTVEVL
jgi:hypothetical protein